MTRWKAHLAVFTANLIYGANYSIAKSVTPLYIKPFGFIVIRAFVATLLFWAIAGFFTKERLMKKDVPVFLACALSGVAVNQLMFFKGLSLTSPINAGLMMISNPIFVLIIAFIFLKNKITWQALTGIALGIAGCSMLLLYGGEYSTEVASTEGDICILINAFSYAVYLVLVKPLMAKYHPLTIMKWIFLFGTVMVLPFGYNEYAEVKWDTFTPGLWMATAFVVIGSTFFAYLFNTIGLISLNPSAVSVYIYLQPLLAAAFAIMLGKDTPNVIHLISALFIFGGVWLCLRPEATKQ